MPQRFPALIPVLLLVLWLLPGSLPAAPPDAADKAAGRLQQLLYGEALFHSRQQDYFTAITRLELAQEEGALPSSSKDLQIMLARLKLAWGLDIDAAFDFHALLDEDVADDVRNRAWYELAKAFFHKGYVEAADEALGHLRGTVPADIAGELSLLRASVLLALKRNDEAARLLEHWAGPPELAGYAWYNRGIALMRERQYASAIESLRRVADLPAEDEEQRALRDKANLSLAWALARSDRLDQARACLEKVRLQGPFSNRALLALGWIAHKQGRTQAALVPWTELRGRSPTDPAVLETLLTVPAVYREMEALQAAAQDYEAAVATYSRELHRLNDTLESVRRGEAVEKLLQDDPAKAGRRAASPETRYLGRLLASRRFQESLQGQRDLQSMLHDIDRGLNNIDRLAGVVAPSTERAAGTPAPAASRRGAAPAAGGGDGGSYTGLPAAPAWQSGLQGPAASGDGTRGTAIPGLPEIELPGSGAGASLPQPEFAGLPQPEFAGLPVAPEPTALLQEPEDIGLPRSEIAWLPETGRLQLPWNEEDYAYPDTLAGTGPGGARHAGAGSDAIFRRPAEPVGLALQQLAAALSSATDRMERLSRARAGSAAGAEGIDQRIAAIRERIVRLRGRISRAMALNERYTRALALAELGRRRQKLEQLLEQANLELAETYDQAAGH